MARWQLPPTVTTNSVTTSYGYDSVGNRLARSATSFPGLTPATYANYDANDRLGTLDGTKVAARFDPNGNTLQYNLDGNTSWDVTDDDEYDFENRLVRRKVASPLYSGGKRWIEIAYDGDGNRVTKTLKDWESGQNPTVDPPRSTSSTKYLVDDQNPSGYAQVLEERDGAGTLLVGYVYGLDLISQTRGNDTHYFGYDSLGTVRYLTDANANVTDIYTYDAFGILIERTARRTADGVLIAFTDPALQTAPAGTQPALNWYRYAGEQWDPDLGMYFLRARYYKPNIGRFWTMDTYQGNNRDPLSLHKYLYCRGNPINAIDPSGCKPYDLFNSLDEAAMDATPVLWDLTENSRSKYQQSLDGHTTAPQGFEYATWFYSRVVDGKEKFYYISPFTSYQSETVDLSKGPGVFKPVGLIHSHPHWDSAAKNWIDSSFSGTILGGRDVGVAQNNKISMYLVTPNKGLKRYDWNVGRVTEVLRAGGKLPRPPLKAILQSGFPSAVFGVYYNYVR